MRYETVEELKDEDFKRCTDVQGNTFERMLAVVETGLRKFGRPTTLSHADQLLITLMYWRECRTEFHIGLTYGVSESTVCRTIQKVENVLIQSKQFHLPGKKALQPSSRLNVQKKTKTALQRQKRRHISIFRSLTQLATPLEIKINEKRLSEGAPERFSSFSIWILKTVSIQRFP